MELDEHVLVYAPEPKHSEYHASSDDDIQVKDDEEDPEEDPSEEHKPKDDDEDPEEDPNEGHELEDEDTIEPSEGSDKTKPFEEDETAITSPPPRHRRARLSAPLGHRTAKIHLSNDIPEEDMLPRRRFVLTTPPPGCDVVKSSAAAVRAPGSQYDFVDTVEAGQGLIRSPGHDTWTIAKAANIVEDVGYVRALQGSEHMMMTSIKEVNLRASYQAQVRMVKGNDVAAYTQHFQELALMCTKFLVDETKKVDKYVSGLPDNIHGNVMSARPKTLDETIELANDLMDQKLYTYAERQNENKRKADDSLRKINNNPIRSKM
nr:reverse transcriptase domain-containing protein [Tanacetum cinerariifolium]